MKRVIAFFFVLFATVAVAGTAIQEKFGKWYLVGVNDGPDKEIWATNELPGSNGDVMMVVSSSIASCDSWRLYFVIKTDEHRDIEYHVGDYGSMDLVIDDKLVATTRMTVDKKNKSPYTEIYLALGELDKDETTALWEAIKHGNTLNTFWVNNTKETGKMTYNIHQAKDALETVTLRCLALSSLYPKNAL